MSKKFAQTISGMVGTSDNEKRYIHKKLADFESSSNKAASLSADNLTSTTNYPSNAALTPVLGKWGKVSQTITWSGSGSTATYALSNITEGLIPQELINQAAVYGVTFNTTTGYFEYGGYTDIAADELRRVICTQNRIAATSAFEAWVERIVLPFNGSFLSVTRIFFRMRRVRYIPAKSGGYSLIMITDGDQTAFQGCYLLESIDFYIYGGSVPAATTFMDCGKLKTIYIHLASKNWNLQYLPVLSMSSVAFFINNSTGSTPITLTLHPDVYAAAQTDADVQAALSSHPLISLVSA